MGAIPSQDELKSESSRLGTFTQWPEDSPLNPSQLAKSGFYYIGPSDRVKCAFCDGVLKGWLSNDNPDVEHRSHFPNCPLMSGQRVGNISIKRSNVPPRPSSLASYLSSPESLCSQVMIDVQKRKESMAALPSSVKQDRRVLAQAGFFYTGHGDSMRCFSCGGALRNWQDHDDPWIEHARWFPKCPHVCQQMGGVFVKDIEANHRSAMSTEAYEGRSGRITLETGLGIYVQGEKEALAGNNTVYIPLLPERNFKGTAEEVHFRIAESQFYRLLSGHSAQYQVLKVEYVVNPHLAKQFRSAQEDLKKSRGEMLAQSVLVFHGTDVNNITNICEQGFLKPGDPGYNMTSGNHYGPGVYFSEYPDLSMAYISGATKLLLCKVLPGKTYTLSRANSGGLRPGFDSHADANGKILVIFDTSRILPCYIVHYTPVNRDA